MQKHHKTTTICISWKTRDEIKQTKKHQRESYDDALQRLLEEHRQLTVVVGGKCEAT